MRRPNPASTPKVSSSALLATLLLLATLASAAKAQSGSPIGRTSAKEVNVSGAVEVHGGEMLLGNGSAITAGDQAVNIALTRGGDLKLCSTTAVHLSRDRTIDAADSTALMMSLDRGAIEANYETGKYSDVLLTPDLRILISGPGHADFKVRVNAKGDTCVDNHGANAPYITVSSQIDGGLYRIQPNQHVMFLHGGLSDVVDAETEPCGCPAAPLSVASAPPSKTADTDFPLAVSEGLAAPPGLPTTPVAKPGEVHAQVTVPLVYNGDAAPAVSSAKPAESTPAAPPPAAVAPPPKSATSQPGFFHRVGRFFSRVFGNG